MNEIDARKRNILNSPKVNGSCDEDSAPYLRELGLEIKDKKQPIQFTRNFSEHVHGWAAYVQGFSAEFVQATLDQYKDQYEKIQVLDPFAGCGTVIVQSKFSGYPSFGTELNPLLSFIGNVKLNSWDLSPGLLIKTYNSIPKNIRKPAPEYLKSEKKFKPKVLEKLEYLYGGIESLPERGKNQKRIKDLMKLAFSAILINCSKLRRTPCLGYSKSKKVDDDAPWKLFDEKVNTIAYDLKVIQRDYKDKIPIKGKVICANSMTHNHKISFDLAITSPPYMNGLDYVMNYKIEMGWLGVVSNHKEAKVIKDDMVVCDNVSKSLIKGFSENNDRYTNEWLDEITYNIERNIERRGVYRRLDMPFIVAKYFDDLYKVMLKVKASLNTGGRFVLVIGDSLIVDVYVPTDLILGKIGRDLGFEIEKIERARNRRSGQIRSYRLRETILTLKKGKNINERRSDRLLSRSEKRKRYSKVENNATDQSIVY